MVIAAALVACACSAHVAEFSSTNVYLLYDSGFHNAAFDYNTVDGKLTTVTL